MASVAYGQALRAVYSRRGLPWRVHDQTVRIDPAVRSLVPHEPESEVFEFLRQTIRPGDVVFDVGAFLGIYAVLEARWTGPYGQVVAFEPTSASAAIARRHLAWNQEGAAGVQLIEAAVSDRRGRATLHEYSSTPYVNSLAAAIDTTAPGQQRQAQTTTIDAVCLEQGVRPAVIRMDVQGAEIHALRGARETIRTCSQLTIVVEMHPQCWPAFGVSDSDARHTIETLGLDIRPLAPGAPLFAPDAHVVLTSRVRQS